MSSEKLRKVGYLMWLWWAVLLLNEEILDPGWAFQGQVESEVWEWGMTEGMVACLCVSPMKDWRLVPRLSPYGSRDSLQPQRDPELVWEGLTEPILRPKTKPVTATQKIFSLFIFFLLVYEFDRTSCPTQISSLRVNFSWKYSSCIWTMNCSSCIFSHIKRLKFSLALISFSSPLSCWNLCVIQWKASD